MTPPADPTRAGADARRAAGSAEHARASRALHRRHRPFARGDRLALGTGAALTLLMLAWFAWRLAQTVARDRAVTRGAPPPAAAPAH
jgi:hypothetical protein